MREALGLTKLLYFALIFLFTFVILMSVGFSYVRAFRVKNRVVDLLAEYETFDKAKEHIGDYLANNKYANTYVNKNVKSCPASKEGGVLVTVNFTNVNPGTICIYELSYISGDFEATYYQVRMPFIATFPVIGRNLTVPLFYIDGETKVLYKRRGR